MTPNVWNDTCSTTGATKTLLDLDANELQMVLDYLESENRFTQFWLPAKWLPPHSIRWMLPGRFGSVQQLNEFIGQPEFEGKGCLSLQVIDNRTILSSHLCHNEFPMICLYAEESPLLQLSCPENHFTTRYGDLQNSCHTVHNYNYVADPKHENTTLFQMTSVEMTYVSQKLMELDTRSQALNCVFDTFDAKNIPGARLSLGEVIPRRLWETYAKDTVSYVNWMKDADFTGDLDTSILVTNAKSEWNFRAVADCMLVTEYLYIEKPVLNLYIVAGTNELQLHVVNADTVWRERDNRGIQVSVQTT